MGPGWKSPALAFSSCGRGEARKGNLFSISALYGLSLDPISFKSRGRSRRSSVFDHHATIPPVRPVSRVPPHQDTMPPQDDISLTILNTAISETHRHTAVLRRIRNSYVSPLCQMPYEIIVKIMAFVPDQNDDDERVSLLLAKTGPICHRIWSILEGSPQFWGHVDLRCPNCPTFMARCQGRPTRLWVQYGLSEAWNDQIHSSLLHWLALPTFSVELLEELRFHGTQGDFDKFSWMYDDPLPRLHSLTVVSDRIQYGWAPEITEMWTISARFPAGLRSIKLKQVTIPWVTCLTSHLVDLDLDYSQIAEEVPISMASFVELLVLCTRLETLRLNCAGPETQEEDTAHDPSDDPVHPTNLRVFAISDDALNIAYIMNNLRLPDTTQIRVEPSIDWPEQLVNFTLPRGTRISNADGLIKWKAGRESTISMGTTEFIYHTDVDDEEFMETFRFTFHFPFAEFAAFSTRALTTLELDFDLEFEPDREVWYTVLVSLPALLRLSCASSKMMSCHFAPKFFAELGKGSHDDVHCTRLEELDLSKFDLHDTKLAHDILCVLRERNNAGFRIQRLSLRHESFEALPFDSLRAFRLCVGEVELPIAVEETLEF